MLFEFYPPGPVNKHMCQSAFSRLGGASEAHKLSTHRVSQTLHSEHTVILLKNTSPSYFLIFLFLGALTRRGLTCRSMTRINSSRTAQEISWCAGPRCLPMSCSRPLSPVHTFALAALFPCASAVRTGDANVSQRSILHCGKRTSDARAPSGCTGG